MTIVPSLIHMHKLKKNICVQFYGFESNPGVIFPTFMIRTNHILNKSVLRVLVITTDGKLKIGLNFILFGE